MKSVAPTAGPASFRAEFCFDPALPVFKGHFPGRPLVPGVLEIEAARCAAESFAGKRYDIVRVDKAKFTAAVTPGDVMIVEGSLATTPEGVQMKATLSVGKASAATLVMLLRERSDVA
jgi:3-hydroxymyristoyl/3-hydroxydecanoyl-(acyl carrier protein) dehydratase